MDERDIIDLITRRFGKLPRGYAPIGDDVALIPPGKPGESVVLKCDMLVAETDVPPGMTWEMAARKAVAMCVSDLASKGTRPSAFMVSLGLPPRTEREKVEELASGLLAAAREWGVRLIGGDTGEAADLIVDCLMVGFAKRIVPRSGARPGECVVTTGSFGQTAAGLKILMEGARADPDFKKVAISSVYFPEPRLEAGLALGPLLSSSIDSSDGLALSLHAISQMSGVGIELGELPFAKGLERFAARNLLSAEELALYGGEEYEIVGTVPKARLAAAKKRARAAGCELRVIGRTVPARRLEGVAMADGTRVRKDGWIHFTGRR